MKHVGVALLGLGVVGGGTYKILTEKREEIRKNEGVDIEVKAILERNIERCKQLGVNLDIVTQDINDILNDDSIAIVAEFFGGVEPAKSFLTSALERGKSIVTANKEMFSKSWKDLETIAQKSGAGIYFEATCMGGVPIIRTLQESMQGNQITAIRGIVNGTTNYILTKMSEEGLDYNTCLKQAQQLGYAEANPTADVEGFDSMYKNSILSSLAYKRCVPIDRISREGINNVDVEDIRIGAQLGYTLKLLAISKLVGDKVECRVHPAFITNDNPLACARDVFNAILLHGDNVDDVLLYGRGAGALPTGSAIVSDIVYCAKASEHRRFAWECSDDVCDVIDDFQSAYYLRIGVDGGNAIGKVAKVFADRNIAIDYISGTSEKGYIVIVTDVTKESVMKEIVENVSMLAEVRGIQAMIRVDK